MWRIRGIWKKKRRSSIVNWTKSEKRRMKTQYWEGRLQKVQREGLESLARVNQDFESERKDWIAYLEEEAQSEWSLLRQAKKNEEEDKRRIGKQVLSEDGLVRVGLVKERDGEIQMIVERVLKEVLIRSSKHSRQRVQSIGLGSHILRATSKSLRQD